MGEDDRFVGIQIVYGQPFTLTLYPSPSPINNLWLRSLTTVSHIHPN